MYILALNKVQLTLTWQFYLRAVCQFIILL